MAAFQKAILTKLGGFLQAGGQRDASVLIPRMEVRRAIVDAMEPLLRVQGFDRFVGGRSLRFREKWSDVIEVQFIKTVGMPANSPSVHVGRYFHFVPEDAISGPTPEKDGRPCPTVERCHIRKTVFKAARQKGIASPNVWFIGGRAAHLDACVLELRVATQQEILPWFDKLDQWDFLLDLLVSGRPDIEGNLMDRVMRGTWNFGSYFSRHVVAGFVALEAGRWSTAASLLRTVLRDGGVVGKGGRVFPLPVASVDRIREAVEVARRHG